MYSWDGITSWAWDVQNLFEKQKICNIISYANR